MSDKLKTQLAESLAYLMGGNYDSIIKKAILKGDTGSDQEFAKFCDEFSNFVRAIRRNSGLVHSLMPSIISIISSLSAFDVRLAHESGTIMSQINELNKAVGSFKDEFNIIFDNQNANCESVKQASDLLGISSTEITKITATINDSKKNIGNMQSKLEGLTSESKDMGNEVDTLIQLTQEIARTIGGIKIIADQTKLLALNASVEAARAGAAGRSFAVVATEIKSLSDNTRGLLDKLNELLSKVQTTSDKSKQRINGTFNSMYDISGLATELFEDINENSKSAESISGYIHNSFKYMQEVSERVQSVTTSVEHGNELVNNISEVVATLLTTSKAIGTTGKSLGDLVNTSGKNVTSTVGTIMQTRQLGLSNQEFITIIETAITAHKNWLGTASEMVRTMSIIPLQTDEHKCAFGHYYFSLTPSNDVILRTWKEIDKVHHNLHDKGKHIIAAVQKNDKQSANTHLKSATAFSDRIIAMFNDIISEVRSLSHTSLFKS